MFGMIFFKHEQVNKLSQVNFCFRLYEPYNVINFTVDWAIKSPIKHNY